MGNSTSSSTKLNEIKKEKASYEEIQYDPDPPRCLASNQSPSFSLPRKIDMENPRFKSRTLPPTPNDETYALSELNHYDPISRGNFICKLHMVGKILPGNYYQYTYFKIAECSPQNSRAMVPKEQVFYINLMFESKNTSRRPSVSISTIDSMPSSRRNSISISNMEQHQLTEPKFEEAITTTSEDSYILQFSGFLADV